MEILCYRYFKECYNKFDAQHNLLHKVGVANTTVKELEGGLQVGQNQIAKVMVRLNAQHEEMHQQK